MTKFVIHDIHIHRKVFTHMTNTIKTEMPILSNDKIQVLENLGLVVKDLQVKCESNSYIDAQVILDYLTDVTKTDEDPNVVPQRVIEKAQIAIEDIDGIPAVNGLPLWERLDCESLDFYKLFKIYREQKTVGIKTESDNVRYQRSFENLKEITGFTRKALYAISKVYHWQMRVSLYDSYRENFIEKENDRMINLMETRHIAAAKNIFEKCLKYFTEIDDKKLSKLAPKDVLSWWNEATKLERLSRGLPGDKIAIEKKDSKTVNITRIDNKTLNVNNPKPDNDYLQKLTDILSVAGALPKQLEAKADIIEAVSDEVIEEGEKKDGDE